MSADSSATELREVDGPVSRPRHKQLIISVLRRFGRLTRSFASARLARFFSAAENSLVIVNGPETYVASANDATISKNLYVHGSFDVDKAEKALSLLNSGKGTLTFVDIGANIGPICIALVNRGLVREALAIEPEPHNFRLLSANIILNDLSSKISAVNVALGERDNEKLAFELSSENYGDHRVRTSADHGRFGEGNRTVIEVTSMKLDTVLAGRGLSDVLIWMDTQGYEGHILAGAQRILVARVPMVIEFWPYAMRRANSYARLKASFLDSGYSRIAELGSPDPVFKQLTEAEFDRLFRDLDRVNGATDILLM